MGRAHDYTWRGVYCICLRWGERWPPAQIQCREASNTLALLLTAGAMSKHLLLRCVGRTEKMQRAKGRKCLGLQRSGVYLPDSILLD